MATLDELLDEELAAEEEALLALEPVTTITPSADPLAVPAQDEDILADDVEIILDGDEGDEGDVGGGGGSTDPTDDEVIVDLPPEEEEPIVDDPIDEPVDEPIDEPVIDDPGPDPFEPPPDITPEPDPDVPIEDEPGPDPFEPPPDITPEPDPDVPVEEDPEIDLPDEPPDLDDTFGPGDTLIDEEILPEESEELAALNDLISQLIAGFEEFGEFNVGTDTQAIRDSLTALLSDFAGIGEFESDAGGTTDLLLELLGGFAEAPDRFELAQRQLDEFIERGEPGFQKRLQGVGRKAATLGRLNSGITTSELGDVALRRERDIGLERERLLTNALQQSFDDILKQVGVTQGVQGQLFGQDLATSQQNLTQMLSEVGITSNALGQLFGQDIAERGIEFSETTDVFQLLSDLQGKTFDQEAVTRAEERIEREFQAEQSQEALQNAILQILLEEDLLDREFARQLQEAELLGSLGGL